MGKHTQRAESAHREACRLVDLPRALTDDEKLFVLDHWLPEPSPDGRAVLFTPSELARDLVVGVTGSRVLDLGAGIGALAFHCYHTLWFEHIHHHASIPELVCIERDPQLVRVGLKVLPEATWIREDLLRLPRMRLRQFDTALAHGPFGDIDRAADAPAYRGDRFEYHTIAVAAQLARRGLFLIPQSSAPFAFSGRSALHTRDSDAEYTRFSVTTGITLGPSYVDTSCYREQWRHSTVPEMEVVAADFTNPAVLRPRQANAFRLEAPRGRISPN